MVGDERSALEAVVAADVELMELRDREEQLNKQLQDTSMEDKPKGYDADDASERLNEVSVNAPCSDRNNTDVACSMSGRHAPDHVSLCYPS